MNRRHARDLAPEREAKLRALLQQQRVVRVEDLCRELGVSAATVRRDLDRLEQAGELQRVHGGAIAGESRLAEPLFEDKASVALAQKRRIALKALEQVEQDACIYLDGGSTVLELARLLHDHSRLTVTTNSLRVASDLAGVGPRLIVVGGELRRLSQTFVGTLTGALLERLHVDTAFMGTIGLSVEAGLTTTDPREAHTKGLVMSRARRVVVLADSSKVGKVSFACSGALSQVDCVITDRGIGRKAADVFRKQGVEVIAV